MRFLYLTVFSCFFVLTACSCNRGGANVNTSGNTGEQKPQQRHKVQVSISSPANNDKFALGSNVVLSVKVKDAADPVDSLRWFIDGKLLKKATPEESVTWNTSGQTLGTHRIEASAFYSSGQRDIVSVSVLLLSDKAPKQYTYSVVQTYPHDTRAYTQGLLFDDGFLYESTGLKGESSLRKVDIKTGESVQVTGLPAEMFGEGLAAVDDKLIQVTWQNQTAFVYRKSTFKLLTRLNYAIREGWGLTYDGKHLLMTDGSATVYFLDKDYLTEVRRVEVCDNKGPVRLLNELEYINGELWANVYQTEYILRIDPATGAVLGRIDMKGLLKPDDFKSDTDVLNGIAYDEKTGKIYVTGKNWPKLFEIRVTEKQ